MKNILQRINKCLIIFFILAFVLHARMIWANAVEKNTYDDRTFEYLTLENGLKVLLVFDPSAKKAAAALDINVGSSYDPQSRLGLAHFVEHMLFLGTEKYPSAGEFQQYMSENGGEHNAYTSLTHTNYYFEINPIALDGALDRFAQFFIAPQFKQQFIEKEINVIDAEYLSKYESGKRRERDVMRSLVVEGHALSRLSVGNADTLNADSLKTNSIHSLSLQQEQERNNNSLRDELLQFFQRNYSADNMALVVSSPYSIDDLKQYVVPRFSQLKQVQIPAHTSTDQLLSEKARGTTVEIQSVRGINRLSLLFPVPETRQLYEEKPLEFIAELVSYQGEGSLYSLFVNLGWATSVDASIDYAWQDGEAFGINLTLTENGLAQKEIIQQLVFDYLQLLIKKGVNKSRYKEIAKKGQMYFRYYEKDPLLSSISNFAADLQYIPANKLLASKYLYTKFNQKLVLAYLSQMTRDNALTILTHPYVKIMEDTRLSDYYGAQYVLHNKSDKVVQLGEIQQQQLERYRKQIKLPKSNTYISDEIELVKHDADEVWLTPKIIRSKYGVTSWFMPDRKYKQPLTFIKSQWTLPAASKSAEAAVSTQLLTLMMERELNLQLYQAKSVGMNFSLTHNLKGVELQVDGFSENISRITRNISSVIGNAISNRRYRQQLVKKHFDAVYREMMLQEKNKTSEGAYVKAYRELPATLYKPRWSSDETLAALKEMTAKQFLRGGEEIFEGAKADIFIYGNETSRSAGRLARYFEKVQRKNKSRPAISPSLVVDISEERYLYVKSMPVSGGDNALMLYVQGHSDDLKERAKFLMLDQMVRAPFYNTLRTEKQLGYIVQSEEYKLKNVPGLICVVQSPNSTPFEIYDTMNTFFFEKAPLIFEHFYQNRKAVLQNLDQLPQTQSETAQTFWLSIMDGDHEFNERQKLREIVANMSIYRMKKFYYSRVLNKTGRVLFVGNKGELNVQSFEKNALLITDAFSFKNSMPVYLYP